jgi:AGCS family alanine or glycine:cation symporter
MVFWGATASLKEVWSMADAALGLMTLVNVYAIVLLTPTIVNITRDYQSQLKANKTPEFILDNVEIQGKTEKGVWQ